MRPRLLPVLALVLAGPLALQVPAGAAVATCDGHRATIVGSSSGETLNGTSHADVIAGLGGDDIINGFGGDDRICGGYGADHLNGGRGDDRVLGGMDRLADTDEGSTERTGDTLRGGWGKDRLLPGRDTRAADEVIYDAIYWDTSSNRMRIDIPAGTAVGNGPDTFVADPAWVVGSNYGDVIEGGSGDDLIQGSWGADTLSGHGGDDRIIGDNGAANEVGADRVLGGYGDDELSTEGGEDVVGGGPGDDFIDDTGRSADQLFGGSGRDHLVGELFDNGIEPVYVGGGGVDTLSLLSTFANPGGDPSTGSWNMATGEMVFDFDGPFPVTASGLEKGDLSTFGASWSVQGTGGDDDVAAGGTKGTSFVAGAGNDTFFGSASDDTFNGGAGTDSTASMGVGDDTCIDVEAHADCEHVTP